MPLLTVDVRLTQQFGLQAAATVPDVTRTAVVGPLNYSETFRGFGDMSVLGWYRLRPVRRWNAVVNVGTSIPTGKTEVPRFRSALDDGSLVPVSRLQRGTGTFDPLLGINVDRRFSRVSVFGSVASRVPVVENEHGLRTGVSLETSGGVSRRSGPTALSGTDEWGGSIGSRTSSTARACWLVAATGCMSLPASRC